MPAQKTVGFLAHLLGGFYMGNVLRGAQQAARYHGLRLLTVRSSANDSLAHLQLLENDLAWDLVDGWAVLLASLTPERQRALAAHGTPRVTISTRLPELNCPAVLADGRGGTAASVRHLLEHGHRRIAFVGYATLHDISERYEGYLAALREAGIAADPMLLVNTFGNTVVSAERALQPLIAAGLPCSAIVAGTDNNAFGALSALAAAGYRVPEDVALVGFDDMVEAQTSVPSLTTVRQSFEALGRAAIDNLAAQLRGEPTPAVTYVETALVVRRSCGCGSDIQALIAAPSHAEQQTWRAALTQQLVELAFYPATRLPDSPLHELWPGVATLVQALEHVLTGQQLPPDQELQRVWATLFQITVNVEVLQTIMALLERVGSEQATDAAAAARLRLFLRRTQADLMRARLVEAQAQVVELETLLITNQHVGLLLSSDATNVRALGWLNETTAVWGCLGLWEAQPGGNMVVAGSYSREGMALQTGQRCPVALFPPAEMLPAWWGPTSGPLLMLMPVRSEQRDWGVLALAAPLEQHVTTRFETLTPWLPLLSAALEREELLNSLHAQQATLRQAYDAEHVLAAVVRELGCPIIPLLRGVLLVPLVGNIDGLRAQQIMQEVLVGVERERATQVLLDITGVPLVDTQVATVLIEVARAATLLGAHVTLVGVRPEIAQSIVGLGLDLSTITTRATLASALAEIR